MNGRGSVKGSYTFLYEIGAGDGIGTASNTEHNMPINSTSSENRYEEETAGSLRAFRRIKGLLLCVPLLTTLFVSLLPNRFAAKAMQSNLAGLPTIADAGPQGAKLQLAARARVMAYDGQSGSDGLNRLAQEGAQTGRRPKMRVFHLRLIN